MRIKNIAHLADIHIRLASRHDEYMSVFKRLSESFKKEDIDLIVIAGDLFHSKVNLSPEAYDIATKMMDMFLEQCDVVLIPGNHDANLQSEGDRLDAISPFVELYKRNSNAKHKIHYLKETQTYEIENVRFFHYSVFDNEQPILDDIKPNKTNIALFHGMIKGAKDDTGITYTETERDIPFSKFDVVMLGDIHKHQQLNDNTWYAGSTIQQKTSEHPTKHGYIKWSENEHNSIVVPEFKPIKNDWGFYTIRFENGDLQSDFDDIPSNASIYVIVSKNDTKEDALEACRKKYNSVKIYPLPEKLDDQGREVVFQKNILDLYDYGTNFKLFDEYLEDEDEDFRKEILDIHKVLFKGNVSKESQRGFKSNYKFKNLQFSNCLPFGEGNEIDFRKMGGTIGLFARNGFGKSSFSDIISYSAHGSFPDMKTNDAFLNSNTKKFETVLELEQDGFLYVLKRTGSKTKSGITNKIEFSREKDGKTENLGDDIPEIKKNIQEHFGDLDTFIQLSYFRQRKNDSFLDLTPTKRNDWITNNIGLEVFDALHQAGKDNSKELRSEVSQLENVDYTAKEADISQEKNRISAEVKEKTKYIKENVQPDIDKLENYIKKLEALNVDQSLVDQTDNINEQEILLQSYQEKIDDLKNKIPEEDPIVKTYQEKINQLRTMISELEKIDIDKEIISESEELNSKLKNITEKGKEVAKKIGELEEKYEKYPDNREKINSLKEETDDLSETKSDLNQKAWERDQLTEKIRTLNSDISNSENKDLCDICPLLKKTDEMKELVTTEEERLKNVNVFIESLSKKIDNKTKQKEELIELEKKQNERLDIWENLQEQVSERERHMSDYKYIKEQISSVRDRKEKEIQDQVKNKKDNISEYESLIENKINDIKQNIDNEIENTNEKIKGRKQKIKELKEKHAKWIEQKEDLEIVAKIPELNEELSKFKLILNEKNDEISELKGDIKYQERLLEENENQRKLLKEKRKEVRAYEKYIEITNRNGLPLSIIKRMLTIFESEVNFVLEKVAEFRAHMYVENDKIMVDIEDFRGRRSADRLGGTESFAFNLAFRIGIAEVGNLPMSNILIIDEHFSVMDSTNAQNIPDLFAYLKSKFDTIFIISHDPAMRDYVDNNIDIVIDGKNSKLVT